MNKIYFTVPANVIDYIKACIESHQVIKLNFNKQQVQSYSEDRVQGYLCFPLTNHQLKLLESAYSLKSEINLEFHHPQIQKIAWDNFNIIYTFDFDNLLPSLKKLRVRNK